MSIDNISQNISINRNTIQKNNNLTEDEKNNLLCIFDAIDATEEDNQQGTITTTVAINNFLEKAKNYLGEKYNKFLEFIANNNLKENDASSQAELSRAKQYETLALSMNINYKTDGKIDKQKTKDILNSGYVDAHGNVTDTPDNIQTAGKYTPTEQDLANMQYVFGQTMFADNFEDHNQMIDAIEYAKIQGVNIDEATVLINCDTHSDVYLNQPSRHSIADWVNAAMAKYPNITDFYWVVSESMVNDIEFGQILSGNKNMNNYGKWHASGLFQNIDIKADLNNGESIQTYYVTSDGYLSSKKNVEEYIEENAYCDNCIGDYEIDPSMTHQIRIHICTEKNLPDFNGQKVISSFDMDYFSNSGVDTITLYRDNKNETELNQAFSQMLQTFADHHIQPIIHGNCYSNDDYLPQEDYKQAQGFANEIIKSTPQGSDVLDEYKHKHERL